MNDLERIRALLKTEPQMLPTLAMRAGMTAEATDTALLELHRLGLAVMVPFLGVPAWALAAVRQ